MSEWDDPRRREEEGLDDPMPVFVDDPVQIIWKAIGQHDRITFGDAVYRCRCQGWTIRPPYNASLALSSFERHRADAVYQALCKRGLLTTAEVQDQIRQATLAGAPDHRFPPELVEEVARVLNAEASDWLLNAPREPHDNPAWRGDVRSARAVLGHLADAGWLA